MEDIECSGQCGQILCLALRIFFLNLSLHFLYFVTIRLVPDQGASLGEEVKEMICMLKLDARC